MSVPTFFVQTEDSPAPDSVDDEARGNGHIRRDSSFRRNGSSRRSRSTPAVENIQPIDEGGLASHRGSKKGAPKEYEPGLRSMLYGLHQKQEKEEAELKKRQKKQLGE